MSWPPDLGTRAPHVLNAENEKDKDTDEVSLRASPEQVSREPASEGSESTDAFSQNKDFQNISRRVFARPIHDGGEENEGVVVPGAAQRMAAAQS